MNDFVVIGGWAVGLLTLVALVLWSNRDLAPKTKK
jgi:hypothetical protein